MERCDIEDKKSNDSVGGTLLIRRFVILRKYTKNAGKEELYELLQAESVPLIIIEEITCSILNAIAARPVSTWECRWPT